MTLRRFERPGQTLLLGASALASLDEAVGDARRVLLVTSPSRRFVDEAVAALGPDREVTVHAGARVHVPRALVEEATAALVRSEADAVVSLGGGASTGLGKMLKRAHPRLRFVAVPTTYAGSELTNIWGTTDDGKKETGRDDAVRPDVVVYDPALTLALPVGLTVQSLLNAMAQPVGALSTGSVDAASPEVQGALGRLYDAARALLADPHDEDARAQALDGTWRAGAVLDGGEMGEQHRVAHRLGGAFDLEHSALHAILLPQLVHHLEAARPEAFAAVQRALGERDPAAALFDLLARARAPLALQDLLQGAAAWDDVVRALDDAALADQSGFVRAAFLGRRPSTRWRRRARPGRDPDTVGLAAEGPRRVVVGLHGRGAAAESIVGHIEAMLAGGVVDTEIVAPAADARSWYPAPFSRPVDEQGEHLARALAVVDEVVAEAAAKVGRENVFVVGFSQGACLALEWMARQSTPLGGVVAIAGARLGPVAEQGGVSTALAGLPLVLGGAEEDPWVGGEAVAATARAFREAGAEVTVVGEPGDAHRITARQRRAAHRLLVRDERPQPHGFGAALSSEALPGALPELQNTPRRAPYGLYPEQVNATGFTAPRHENRRAWLYRVRPATQHRALAPLDHPTLRIDYDDVPPAVDLCGWGPAPMPDEATDFVDGLATFGGAGHPTLRRGYAVHVYAANRSMEDRAFSTADGDLLLIPQEGELVLLTEHGFLDVGPGRVALLPRGLRFSVLLGGTSARGWVLETYGRAIGLPERGPVGANGLTDERHFVAPHAFFEDRLSPGFRVTTKHAGQVYEATQDHSPYDVAAWHGTWAPFVYDLASFSPVSNVHRDHADPSIYTVLTAPMDEPGSHTVDFVVFPPRWDPTEHTFRPPFFHRNATTELNGIVRNAGAASGPFQPGTTFLTPALTPHGVVARAVERNLRLSDEEADRPARMTADSLWFQLETALPLSLSRWAREASHRHPRWRSVWGQNRTFFTSHHRAPEV